MLPHLRRVAGRVPVPGLGAMLAPMTPAGSLVVCSSVGRRPCHPPSAEVGAGHISFTHPRPFDPALFPSAPPRPNTPPLTCHLPARLTHVYSDPSTPLKPKPSRASPEQAPAQPPRTPPPLTPIRKSDWSPPPRPALTSKNARLTAERFPPKAPPRAPPHRPPSDSPSRSSSVARPSRPNQEPAKPPTSARTGGLGNLNGAWEFVEARRGY